MNIWQSYKQELYCFVHFAHLANRERERERDREFIYQVDIHKIYISIVTMAGCQ